MNRKLFGLSSGGARWGLGDVVVLSDDYFAVRDSALRGLHSALTVVGGTVVHSGPVGYWA